MADVSMALGDMGETGDFSMASGSVAGPYRGKSREVGAGARRGVSGIGLIR